MTTGITDTQAPGSETTIPLIVGSAKLHASYEFDSSTRATMRLATRQPKLEPTFALSQGKLNPRFERIHL